MGTNVNKKLLIEELDHIMARLKAVMDCRHLSIDLNFIGVPDQVIRTLHRDGFKFDPPSGHFKSYCSHHSYEGVLLRVHSNPDAKLSDIIPSVPDVNQMKAISFDSFGQAKIT